MSQLSGAQRSRLASEVHGLKDQLLGLQSHDGTMTVSGLGSVDYGDPLAMHNSTVANHKAMKVLQMQVLNMCGMLSDILARTNTRVQAAHHESDTHMRHQLQGRDSLVSDLKRKVEIMAVTRDTERKTAKSRVREVNNKIQGLTMTLDRTRAKLKMKESECDALRERKGPNSSLAAGNSQNVSRAITAAGGANTGVVLPSINGAMDPVPPQGSRTARAPRPAAQANASAEADPRLVEGCVSGGAQNASSAVALAPAAAPQLMAPNASQSYSFMSKSGLGGLLDGEEGEDVVLSEKMKGAQAAGLAIIGDLRLPNVVSRIVDGCITLLDCENVTVWSVKGHDQSAELCLLGVETAEPVKRYPLKKLIMNSLVGHVASEGVAQRHVDASTQLRYSEEIDAMGCLAVHSLMIVPLRDNNGEIVGIIKAANKLGTTDSLFFSHDDQEVAAFIGRFAGPALVNAQSYSQVMYQRDRSLQTAAPMSVELDVPSLLRMIMVQAKEVLASERCNVFLVDEEEELLWSKFMDEEIRIPLHEGIPGLVVDSGKMLNIQKAYEHPSFDPRIDQRTGYETRCILCAPIKSSVQSDKVIGIVRVINKKGGTVPLTFSRDDEILMDMLCTQAALAFENSKVFHRSMEMSKSLQSLAADLDLEALSKRIIEKAEEFLKADGATLYMVDAEANEIWRPGADFEGEAGRFRCSVSRSVAGHVAQYGDLINVTDVRYDPHYDEVADTPDGCNPGGSILSMPVYDSMGEICAVLSATSESTSHFDRQDEILMKVLASQCGFALTNAALYQAVREDRERMEKVMDTTRALHLAVAKKPDVANLFREVRAQARDLFNCQRVRFYLVDHSRGDLYCKIADTTNRIGLDCGILAHVARTGDVLNLTNADDLLTEVSHSEVDANPSGEPPVESTLVSPLCNSSGETVAVIQLINKNSATAQFDSLDEDVLLQYSAHVAVAIDTCLLFKSPLEDDRGNGLQSVYMDVKLDAVVERINRQAVLLSKAHYSNLFLLDTASKDRALSFKSPDGTETRLLLDEADGIACHSATHSEMVVCSDARQDPRFNPIVDQLPGMQTGSLVSLPVADFSGEMVGVLQVYNKQHTGRFTREDQGVLKLLAKQAGVALRNAIVHDHALMGRKRLEKVLDAATTLNSQLDMGVLSGHVQLQLQDLFSADRGTLFLVDGVTGQLVSHVKTTDGGSAGGSGGEGETEEVRQQLGKGIPGHVVTTRELVNVQDAYRDDRFDPSTDQHTGYRTRHILAIPVCTKSGDCVAVMQLVNRIAGGGGASYGFGREDEELLTLYSHQVAIAIVNCSRLSSTRKQLAEANNSSSKAAVSVSFVLDRKRHASHVLPGSMTLFGLTPDVMERSPYQDWLLDTNSMLLDGLEEMYRAPAGEEHPIHVSGFLLDAGNGRSYRLDFQLIPVIPDQLAAEDCPLGMEGVLVVFNNVTHEQRTAITRGVSATSKGSGQETLPVIEAVQSHEASKDMDVLAAAAAGASAAALRPNGQLHGAHHAAAILHIMLLKPDRAAQTVSGTSSAVPTALGGPAGPSTVVLQHFADMSAAIVGSVLDHSGVVHSALDDSIVAVFGLSRASSRDVDKAISCALNIKRKVADNNAGTLDEGGLNMAIQVRIGVHVGEIMTGDVDSAFLGNTDPVLLQSIGSNLEYNLQHDALADVKHLADAARNYPSPCIFMSDVANNIVANRVVSREVDMIPMGSKASPMQVFDLMHGSKSEQKPVEAKLLAAFQRGLDNFKAHELEQAEVEFRKATEMGIEDGPSQFYLERTKLALMSHK